MKCDDGHRSNTTLNRATEIIENITIFLSQVVSVKLTKNKRISIKLPFYCESNSSITFRLLSGKSASKQPMYLLLNTPKIRNYPPETWLSAVELSK